MSILLLDIPGLRLGYLGFYGNPWVATPNLDRLASQSVVFDRHFAGWHQDEFHIPLCANEDVSLEESCARLVDAVLTGMAKAAGPISARFPRLAPPWRLAPELLGVYFDEESEDDEQPWPDPPEKLPPGQLRRLQNTYAAVVTFMDAQFGKLVDELAERNILDRLLLIVTSSQGMPLGEHGWIGRHRAWLHEEHVHLPLLMRLPNAAQAGLRVAALTQPADIAETAAEFLSKLSAPGKGGPRETIDPRSQGFSLWPLIRQEATAIRPFACSADQVDDSVEWSLRTLEYALLLPVRVPPNDAPRTAQLYVKPDDRWEVNNVIHHHAETAEQLEKALREFASEPEA